MPRTSKIIGGAPAASTKTPGLSRGRVPKTHEFPLFNKRFYAKWNRYYPQSQPKHKL